MTKIIDKLAWLQITDKKLLCARSKGKELFYIPGGKREEGESDQQALIREIREELTVDLIPSTIEYVNRFEAQAHGKAAGVVVQMSCYSAEYEGTLTSSSEIAEIAWLGYGDKERCSLVTQLIVDWLQKSLERG